MTPSQEALQRAEQFYLENDYVGAFRILKTILASGDVPPGTQYLRCLCHCAAFEFSQALEAASAELAANPSHPAAAQEAAALRVLLEQREISQRNDRDFSSSIPRHVALAFERASFHYKWRGVRLMKNPLDLALYPLLIWNDKPATILEIGSFDGGSAVWMGDLLQSFGLDTRIYSFDINPVTAVSHPRVSFRQADARNLAAVLTPDFLASVPRPWLVIEDAAHTRDISLAILEFFHPHLRPGEHIIIEDGMSCFGPRLAIQEFFQRHPGEYVVDRNYTDFFGYNATWCLNGYLRKQEPRTE